ncbi:MAG: hypothetical protein HY294_11705 [Candidatus Rokubacteria bacterium]|nr:hypothetical protein [Candidatus Rokubacteria bacterium]MBI3826654.1 hypothetical protein [Candidatus Rokubacteria bacterium]
MRFRRALFWLLAYFAFDVGTPTLPGAFDLEERAGVDDGIRREVQAAPAQPASSPAARTPLEAPPPAPTVRRSPPVAAAPHARPPARSHQRSSDPPAAEDA